MRIGLCCMTINMDNNLHFWIRHHLDTLKIDVILLRWEVERFPTQDHDPYIPKDDRVWIVEKETVESHYNSYLSQQIRQIEFVNRCLRQYSANLGLDYLVHLDDDELLIVHPKWHTLHSYLQQVSWRDETHLRIQNFEGVLDSTSAQDILFLKTRAFKDCSIEACRGYANGKSIAKLSSARTCNGCHTFSGPALLSPKKDVVVLHYDSLDFEKWQQKFTRLRAISEMTFQRIPFDFYRDSIKIMSSNVEEKKKYWLDRVSACERPLHISINRQNQYPLHNASYIHGPSDHTLLYSHDTSWRYREPEDHSDSDRRAKNRWIKGSWIS